MRSSTVGVTGQIENSDRPSILQMFFTGIACAHWIFFFVILPCSLWLPSFPMYMTGVWDYRVRLVNDRGPRQCLYRRCKLWSYVQYSSSCSAEELFTNAETLQVIIFNCHVHYSITTFMLTCHVLLGFLSMLTVRVRYLYWAKKRISENLSCEYFSWMCFFIIFFCTSSLFHYCFALTCFSWLVTAKVQSAKLLHGLRIATWVI